MALLCSSAARRFYSLQAQMASMVSDDTELAGWLVAALQSVWRTHTHMYTQASGHASIATHNWAHT